MYDLPANFDPRVFVGCELVQVSFTANTVHLSFDGEVAITMECSFAVRVGPGTEALKQTVPVQDSPLMALAGRRVQAARRDGSTLTLAYEGGGMLACFDDSPQYESYRIRIGPKEIVV